MVSPMVLKAAKEAANEGRYGAVKLSIVCLAASASLMLLTAPLWAVSQYDYQEEMNKLAELDYIVNILNETVDELSAGVSALKKEFVVVNNSVHELKSNVVVFKDYVTTIRENVTDLLFMFKELKNGFEDPKNGFRGFQKAIDEAKIKLEDLGDRFHGPTNILELMGYFDNHKNGNPSQETPENILTAEHPNYGLLKPSGLTEKNSEWRTIENDYFYDDLAFDETDGSHDEVGSFPLGGIIFQPISDELEDKLHSLKEAGDEKGGRMDSQVNTDALENEEGNLHKNKPEFGSHTQEENERPNLNWLQKPAYTVRDGIVYFKDTNTQGESLQGSDDEGGKLKSSINTHEQDNEREYVTSATETNPETVQTFNFNIITDEKVNNEESAVELDDIEKESDGFTGVASLEKENVRFEDMVSTGLPETALDRFQESNDEPGGITANLQEMLDGPKDNLEGGSGGTFKEPDAQHLPPMLRRATIIFG